MLVVTILENTVDNARRREAILDEALASTDKTLEKLDLPEPKDQLGGLDDSLPMNKDSKQAAQEVTKEEQIDDT